MVIPVMFGVTLLSFLLLHLAPGDPAILMAGPEQRQEVIEAIRAEYGLDKPIFVQYLNYLKGVLRGDFGKSIMNRWDIGQLLRERLRVTVKLSLFSMGISFALGILVGIVAATHQNSIFDWSTMLLALFGASMPIFWFGLLLMMAFSVTLRLFPAGGGTDLYSLVLPAVALGTSAAALIARMTRASMLEVIRQDYLRTARANGISEGKIVYRHALKNAMIPIITVVGLQFGYMLGGAVIAEAVFAIPGVGSLLIEGIASRDYPVVQSTMFMIATVFVLVNLLTDIAYAFFDPRIRYQ
jgi:peptide/nickel transport system permease protein